jgi:hypothetical protein
LSFSDSSVLNLAAIKVVQTVSICRPKHMRMFRLLYIYTLIIILKVGFTARTYSLRQLGLT